MPSHTPSKSFGELLKEARDARGWTQKDLSARSGLDQGFISKLEKGKRNIEEMSIRRFYALTQLFPFQASALVASATASVKHLRPVLLVGVSDIEDRRRHPEAREIIDTVKLCVKKGYQSEIQMVKTVLQTMMAARKTTRQRRKKVTSPLSRTS